MVKAEAGQNQEALAVAVKKELGKGVQVQTGAQRSKDIADRLPLPVSVLRTTLADFVTAWNTDPRARAQIALRDVGDVKTRLVHQTENSVREHVTQSASETARRERRLVNQPQRPDRHRSLDV